MISRTIFPDLKKFGLTRLLLTGHLHCNSAVIRRYWLKSRRLKVAGFLSLDGRYHFGHTEYYRRLFFRVGKRKDITMFIDCSVETLPKVPSSGRVGDKDLIGFCNWFVENYTSADNHFAVLGKFTTRHNSRMSLPFDGKFIVGAQFKFSKTSHLDFAQFEKVGNQIEFTVKSKQVYRLDGKLINERFFEKPINQMKQAQKMMFPDGLKA